MNLTVWDNGNALGRLWIEDLDDDTFAGAAINKRFTIPEGIVGWGAGHYMVFDVQDFDGGNGYRRHLHLDRAPVASVISGGTGTFTVGTKVWWSSNDSHGVQQDFKMLATIFAELQADDEEWMVKWTGGSGQPTYPDLINGFAAGPGAEDLSLFTESVYTACEITNHVGAFQAEGEDAGDAFLTLLGMGKTKGFGRVIGSTAMHRGDGGTGGVPSDVNDQTDIANDVLLDAATVASNVVTTVSGTDYNLTFLAPPGETRFDAIVNFGGNPGGHPYTADYNNGTYYQGDKLHGQPVLYQAWGRMYYAAKDAQPLQVETPTISPDGATSDEPVEVTLECATAGADIFYTLDGSEPDDSSTEYTGPFTLSESATVKVIGIKSGMMDSEIAEAEFVISIIGTGVAPLITAFTIASNGATGTLTFDRSVTGSQGFAFQVGQFPMLATVSGSGSTRTVTFARALYTGERVFWFYDQGRGNMAATSDGTPMLQQSTPVQATNNSTLAPEGFWVIRSRQGYLRRGGIQFEPDRYRVVEEPAVAMVTDPALDAFAVDDADDPDLLRTIPMLNPQDLPS